MKMARCVFVCLLAGSICLSAAVFVCRSQQQSISNKLIRLHVIANSDSPEDQQQKLLVRDAVLSSLRAHSWSSRQEAALWIRDHLQQIAAAGEAVLDDPLDKSIQAQLCREHYPTRRYESFSLPCGTYLSLKVTIGDGNGKNWWCVVYPGICTVPAEELLTAASMAELTKDEVIFITEDTGKIRFKFWLLELFRELS